MKMQINKYIIADAEVCHGKPVFKGTRIMVWQVIDLLATGVTPAEIIKNYFPTLNKEAILAALSYASKTVEGESYVSF